VFVLTPTPLANAFIQDTQLEMEQPIFPLELFFCKECSHLQLSLVVNPEILFRDYLYVSGTSKSFTAHFQEYADYCIGRFTITSNDLVVDIGSNDGTFLSFFKTKNIDVLGIDPARSIAAEAIKNGVETWPEFFTQTTVEQIKKKKQPAKLVSANNMFAHADNLGAIAESIGSLLAPDGVFIFEVSYLGAIYEDTLFDTIYHEHLAYHSILPLDLFFKSKNMDLFAVERIKSHGGSIRGMVQLSDGPYKADGSVQSLINYEIQLALNNPQTWVQFGKNIDLLRNQLTKLLSRLKNEGNSIAGYGAAAKATTLMYHFNIGQNIIDFLIDDSPLKQGLYSPGLHIPVEASQAIYEKKPDYILILAWNFASQIMNSHQEYSDRGGKFISPLPEVKVY